MFISSIRSCSICSNDCNANNLPTQVNFKLSNGSTTTTTATKQKWVFKIRSNSVIIHLNGEPRRPILET